MVYDDNNLNLDKENNLDEETKFIKTVLEILERDDLNYEPASLLEIAPFTKEIRLDCSSSEIPSKSGKF